ncbi:MAG: hypothetical protein HN657_01750 [Candidatus Marinimicrobia bacterium]|jgi:O-antigen biosynthesis protein WbqP|nr:hypothetical protein [Candidatus Neomarinimicrobiota bacterium]MBT3497154.1 hypothetical protein [Candidatus Neomarinimicrobiota bacterium]MBT3691896.1 hypothetical protein [Candidatus Neomarinimicrobiota bacterium]MBT3732614.1 hypothetical protein [Candidatus Neomarinimicrobiota bacterium]MBT4144243.1 hypothetical protein [Candidatus Neomarinimicrobiota bacterium]
MVSSKIFCLILLICISPILALLAIVIILDDGSPILFRQKRVGRNNTHFWIYKFRTMKKDTPDKVKMDEYYLKNQSFWLDLKIIWLTILKVFKADGVKK